MLKLLQKPWLCLGFGLLVFALAGCGTSPTLESGVVQLTAEQRKLDEKQISLAIRECLHKDILKVERPSDSAQEVAERLHQRCEVPFMALRQSKLGYLDLPDIQTPPTQVKNEEVAVCLEVVERFRAYRKEAIKKRLREMPPGWKHPVIPGEKPVEQTDIEKGFF